MKAPKRFAGGGKTPKPSAKMDLNTWSPEMEAQAKKAYEAHNNSAARKNLSVTGGDTNHSIGSEGALGTDPKTGKQYTDFAQDSTRYKYISGVDGKRVFQSAQIAPYGKNDTVNPAFPNGMPLTYAESTNVDGSRRLLQVPTSTYKPNAAPLTTDVSQNFASTNNNPSVTYQAGQMPVNINPETITTGQQKAPASFLTGNTAPPSITNYKKGGIVKGYVKGGAIKLDADQVDGIAQGVGYIDESAGNIIDAKSIDPETGLYKSKGSAAGVGALKGAGQGIKMGAGIGTAIGGPVGTAIGAGAGAVLGAGIGATTNLIRQNRAENALDNAKQQNTYNQARLGEYNSFQANLNKQMMDRQAGYANGGVIKGAGTGKSDSIVAKVKGGSFVVPEENAPLAEEVRSKILKAPSTKKKANLNQEEGAVVRLSNGEHLFDPKEKKKIVSELGEEFLEELAPNADDESKEKAKGGSVDGEGDNAALIKANKDKLNSLGKENAKKTLIALQKEEDDLNKTPNKSIVSNRLNEIAATKKKLISDYKLEDNQTTNTPSKSGKEIAKALGTNPQIAPKVGINGTSKARVNGAPKGYVYPTGETNTDVPIYEKPKVKGTALMANAQDNALVNSELSAESKAKTDSGDNSKRTALINAGKGLAQQAGGLANYILPYKQYQLGQQYLAKAGPRPIDKVDPDFQKAVNQSQVNATYGFTPQEQALRDQQNVSALRSNQFAANNYSGGSSGNAYVMSRDAANNYFGRGLQNQVASKNLQLDKQQLANNMVMAKADKSRQLFNDTMTGWNTNQQAGSNLLGAGLQNLMGAQRYNQEMQFNRDYADSSNPWKNYNING